MTEYFLALIRGERRGPLAMLQRAGLRLASVPYATATWLRNRLYDRGWQRVHTVAVPVVSVGNLTVGGTGKTPCVEYIARWFRDQERQVALLSRGYGAEQGRNDEALVLEENLPDVPHLQGPDRVALAQTAIEELESDVLVLDDGFQHRRLARALDVVLLDATAPWGYGWQLPGGLLREAAANLCRADIVLLTRCDLVSAESIAQLRQEVARCAPGVPLALTTHQPTHLVNAEQTRPLSVLHGRPVALLSGIGNPTAFRRTVEQLGAAVVAERVFADHHAYTRADVEDLRRWAQRLAPECVVMTTQKDLVKLRLTQLAERELWALRIQLHFHEGQELLDRKLKDVHA